MSEQTFHQNWSMWFCVYVTITNFSSFLSKRIKWSEMLVPATAVSTHGVWKRIQKKKERLQMFENEGGRRKLKRWANPTPNEIERGRLSFNPVPTRVYPIVTNLKISTIERVCLTSHRLNPTKKLILVYRGMPNV